MMPIQAVIWDYGGVLVRTEDQLARVELAKQLGVELQYVYDLMFNSVDARKGMRGEISGRDHWLSVGRKFNMTGEEMQERFFSGDELDHELMQYIQAIRSQVRTGLLSNAFDTLRTQLIEGRKIAEAFDEIVISAEVGMMKPDAEIYHLTLERLQLPANQTVFIDDFIENVRGARDVGMQAIHFQSREQTIKEIEGLLGKDL